ncbi:hypothetical protein K8Z61_15065 [Nocardioides sp. TRM66260-LWL]|uniref:hypothetical protein n=1 Tax=Nocardioides sp. TRM66260-LWL TaxID=2874478 RepID=UPI001CC7B7DE|nr:hypothetical protein [Nocardioides sp. TRM66260-LWL]MBZ5735813.1 hypothetical protein [Nocardioides sp. TRM66260-LWL]
MTETFIETPEEPTSDFLQVIAAILLGIAATLTAFSAYNSALTDGEALQGYTEASQKLADSNFYYGQGNQVEAGDRALFVAYATATQDDKADLAEYLKTLMRPELVEAVDWWVDAKDAVTPFDEADDNPYENADYAEGQAQGEASKQTYEEAKAADERGDKFELATVFLALTLFFGGIATLFSRRSVRLTLLVVGTGTLAFGSSILLGAL